MDGIKDEETIPSVPFIPSKKSTSNIIKIVVGIVLLAILAAGVSLATRVWDPVWNPFRPKPEEVLARMTIKMEELDYLRTEMKMIIAGKEGEKESFVLSLVFSGDSDNTDLQNPKSAGDFDIVWASEGTQLTVGGEIRTIGETSYIKLTTLPVVPLAELPIDLAEFKNQWFKIDSESSQEWLRALVETFPPEIQLMFGQMIEAQIEAQKEIQKEMQEKLEKLIVDKRFYLIKRELPDGKIENQKVYRYLVALNNERIKEIVLEMMEIYMETYFDRMFSIEMFPVEFRPSPAEMEMLKKETIGEMEKSLDDFFEKLGEIEGEVLISKKNFYLNKIKMEKEIDLAKIQPIDKRKIVIKLDMDFSNFNKPVKIEMPKEYKDLLKDLLLPLIETSLGEARVRAKDAYIQASMNQLLTVAEMHSFSQRPESYANLCLSSDVISLKEDIIEKGGTNFSCHVQTGIGAGKSYCIEVRLNSGDWWCIDSTLRSKQYGNKPACVSCIGKTCQCE